MQMKLTDLQETAGLARLSLSEEELKKTFPAFEEMISFFTVMQVADTDGNLPAVSEQVDGMAASSKPAGAAYLRPDSAPREEQDNESLLSQTPERDGRFIVIPNVL